MVSSSRAADANKEDYWVAAFLEVFQLLCSVRLFLRTACSMDACIHVSKWSLVLGFMS